MIAERMFLLKEGLDLKEITKGVRPKKIVQGFLQVGEASVRYRSIDNKYYKGSKTSQKYNAAARQGVEDAITKKQFELAIKTCQWFIYKNRYSIMHENQRIDLDIFSGELEGLILIDVDFPSLTDANSFKPLAWFGKEVTKDRNYLVHNLNDMWRKRKAI